MKRFAVFHKGEKQTELYAKDTAGARVEFAKIQARSPAPFADFDQNDVQIKAVKAAKE